MQTVPTRIVKVGGSLLEFDQLAKSLTSWLAKQPPAVNVLLAGGGQLADVVRDWDNRFAIGELHSHQLCIKQMGITSQLLTALLGQFQRITHWDQLPDSTKTVIFDPEPFLSDLEPTLPGTRLPATWETTSDSIAARLAEVLGAAELVLLKSATLPPNQTHQMASNSGYVDAHFPQAAAQIPHVRCVNLRFDINSSTILKPSKPRLAATRRGAR